MQPPRKSTGQVHRTSPRRYPRVLDNTLTQYLPAYPIRHGHHPHHGEFQQTRAHGRLRLPDDAIERVLGWMDGGIDMGKEDLLDICKPAVARA
jgi:hypothetical protein